jgi:hypothetical protein
MKSSQLEQEVSRKWLEAALAGNLDSAWSASDRIRQAQVDYSGRQRWCRSLWDGTPIVDRHVIIRCWRRLGDAIHFIRYASLIRAQAKSLTVEAPGELLPLLKTVSGVDQVVELDSGQSQNESWVEIESTELPYVFRTTLDSIPSGIPYIHVAKPTRQNGRATKVGLCWCGGSFDPRRSIPLSDLKSLKSVPDLRFFQLQRGPALREIDGSSIWFDNLADCSMDLSATASLIDSLDVIVSVDTMVAHLAGALGKKGYLLLHTEADWRWLREREDSPWYPTVRLLRQSTAGDWAPVVSRLVNLLMEDGSNPPL